MVAMYFICCTVTTFHLRSGALGFDLDCQFVSTNAKFHNKVIQELLRWIPQQFQGFSKLFQMRVREPDNGFYISTSVPPLSVLGLPS